MVANALAKVSPARLPGVSRRIVVHGIHYVEHTEDDGNEESLRLLTRHLVRRLIGARSAVHYETARHFPPK